MAKPEDDKIKEYLRILDNFSGEHLQPNVDIVDEYAYPIKAFLRYIDKVMEDLDYYSELQSYCDQAMSDILHCLELNNTSAVERSRLTSKLVNVLRTRRAVKTHFQCAQVVADYWVRSKQMELHRYGSDTLKRLSGLENRDYTYRTNVVEDALNTKEEPK